MNTSLNWYERVLEELKNEQSYFGRDSYYEFIEYLNDSLIFDKKIANKHPVIGLYDFQPEEEKRVNYISFDPSNQQFYVPVYNDEIEMNMHIILNSFEDIQKFFVGSWIRYSRLLKDGFENESKDVNTFQNFLDIITQ